MLRVSNFAPRPTAVGNPRTCQYMSVRAPSAGISSNDRLKRSSLGSEEQFFLVVLSQGHRKSVVQPRDSSIPPYLGERLSIVSFLPCSLRVV